MRWPPKVPESFVVRTCGVTFAAGASSGFLFSSGLSSANAAAAVIASTTASAVRPRIFIRRPPMTGCRPLSAAAATAYPSRRPGDASHHDRSASPAARRAPGRHHVAAFDRVILGVLRRGQAGVVGKDAYACADVPGLEVRVGRQLDLAVLLGDAVDARARVAAVEGEDAAATCAPVDVARPEVLRKGDGAGVEHDAAAYPVATHHRGEHGHGRVVGSAASVRHLEGVEEGVVAGPGLGDARG